ncbi:hypothetical protein KY289_011273 [Solanum tuberosum]|nr:hypothetical protein KY289_011273 [Solanum tuberosum]
MGYAVMLLLVFLCHEVSSISILPHKHQTISLLKFKQSFTIDTSASGVCEYGQESYPKRSSWNTSRDCCSWDGVVCDDITGHVIELDLGCSGLVGTIDSNSSLFQLSHLQMLDLTVVELVILVVMVVVVPKGDMWYRCDDSAAKSSCDLFIAGVGTSFPPWLNLNEEVNKK